MVLVDMKIRTQLCLAQQKTGESVLGTDAEP